MEDKKIYYRVNFDMYIENIEVVKIIHDENSKYFDRVYFSKIDLADAFQEYGVCSIVVNGFDKCGLYKRRQIDQDI